MPNLPISPRYKRYRGSKENLQRKSHEAVRVAHLVADHVNRLIANNPAEMQMIIFASVAYDLKLTTEQVRSAISNGGYNGRTIRVDENDRRELARYKTSDSAG